MIVYWMNKLITNSNLLELPRPISLYWLREIKTEAIWLGECWVILLSLHQESKVMFYSRPDSKTQKSWNNFSSLSSLLPFPAQHCKCLTNGGETQDTFACAFLFVCLGKGRVPYPPSFPSPYPLPWFVSFFVVLYWPLSDSDYTGQS